MAANVSIGVPVYNGERYVLAALQSIADQTYGDYEVIISDNASTDGTEEICRSFAMTDSRFRYSRVAENRGAAWNYNQVLHDASGDYFKWAAHDDLHAPTFVERCVEVLDGAPDDVVLCYPKTVLIDADGQKIEDFDDRLDLRSESACRRFATYLLQYRRSNAMFGLYRRERLLRTRLHGNYVSADLVLLAEIALDGQIWEINDRLFYRRWHEEMSRKANVTEAERTSWFDPSRDTGHLMPRTRLFAEHARAIGRARIPMAEKACAMNTLTRTWVPRYWRVVGGEFKRELLGGLRLRRGA